MTGALVSLTVIAMLAVEALPAASVTSIVQVPVTGALGAYRPLLNTYKKSVWQPGSAVYATGSAPIQHLTFTTGSLEGHVIDGRFERVSPGSSAIVTVGAVTSAMLMATDCVVALPDGSVPTTVNVWA